MKLMLIVASGYAVKQPVFKPAVAHRWSNTFLFQAVQARTGNCWSCLSKAQLRSVGEVWTQEQVINAAVKRRSHPIDLE